MLRAWGQVYEEALSDMGFTADDYFGALSVCHSRCFRFGAEPSAPSTFCDKCFVATVGAVQCPRSVRRVLVGGFQQHAWQEIVRGDPNVTICMCFVQLLLLVELTVEFLVHSSTMTLYMRTGPRAWRLQCKNDPG